MGQDEDIIQDVMMLLVMLIVVLLFFIGVPAVRLYLSGGVYYP